MIESEIKSEDIIHYFSEIKDLIFTAGDASNIFGNSKELTREAFVKFVSSRTDRYSEAVLNSVFSFITKMERSISRQEFNTIF